MFATLPASVDELIAMSIALKSNRRPSVTVLTVDEATRAALCRLIEATSFELTSSGSLDDAGGEMPLGDIIVADIRDVVDGSAEAQLHRLRGNIGSSRELIVRAALGNLDDAVEICPDDDIVVGGDETDLRMTLAAAASRLGNTSDTVNDVASDEGLRLQHLADEIGLIARTLIDLPQGLGTASGLSDGPGGHRAGPADNGAVVESEITAAEVRGIIRLRRMRERFFSSELFADPAWDMLLDLSAARIERSRVAVSSLCIAAAVPPTTALRWIKAMTDRGLLRRIADAHDARRIFIQLSDDAAAAMDKYLRAARASGLPII